MGDVPRGWGWLGVDRVVCAFEVKQWRPQGGGGVQFAPPADRGRCRADSSHSHGVVAALLFGLEQPHGQEAPGLDPQHQDDAPDEAGQVEPGLGQLGGRVAPTSVP